MVKKVFSIKKEEIKLENDESIIFHKIAGQDGVDFKGGSQVGFEITVTDQQGKEQLKQFRRFNTFLTKNNKHSDLVNIVLPIGNAGKGYTTTIKVVNLKSGEQVICQYDKL